MALSAARWAFNDAPISDAEYIGAAQKIARALTDLGLGLTLDEQAAVDAFADEVFHDAKLGELLTAGVLDVNADIKGDAISKRFMQDDLPYGRRVLVMVRCLRRVEERLADSPMGKVLVAIEQDLRAAPEEETKTRKRTRSSAAEIPATRDAPGRMSADALANRLSVETDPDTVNAGRLDAAENPVREDASVGAPDATIIEVTSADEANQDNAEASSPAPPVTLRDAELVLVESIKGSEPVATAEQDDFDPSQSAERWPKDGHDGAVVRRLDHYLYYEGQGALRLDAPPGTGPVRLCAGYRWHYSRADGLFRDESRDEWQARASAMEEYFFAGFDTPGDPSVANPIPQQFRGYVGPGRTLSDLTRLAKTLRPAGPYQPLQFEPTSTSARPYLSEKPKIHMEKIGALKPTDFMKRFDKLPKEVAGTRPYLRLLAQLDPTFEDDWQAASAIDKPAWIGFEPATALEPAAPGAEAFDEEAVEEPVYAETAAILRTRCRLRWPDLVRAGSHDIDTPILQGHHWLLSGPSGSGKSHRLLKIASRIDAKKKDLSYEIEFFFLNMRTSSRNAPGRWFDLWKLDDLVAAAKESLAGGKVNILLVDEYAELSAPDLAKLRPFNQIVMAGDYAQGVAPAQPAYDFMWRARGGSSVASLIWRGKRCPLFALVSILAYDGAFRTLSSATSLKHGSEARACFVSYCPDDPQCEALAAYLCALPYLEAGRTVAIVVDDHEAVNAINAVAFESPHFPPQGRKRHPRLLIFASRELRGHECDVIIVATGALDRAGLPTSTLLERLIVLLGRATFGVHIILPQGDFLGSEKRRFSALVQPILSYRILPPKTVAAPFAGLTSALADHDFAFAVLDGHLVCDHSDPAFLPKLISIAGESDPLEIAMARHKRWDVIEIDPDFVRLDLQALKKDERFATLLEALKPQPKPEPATT